MQNTMKQHLNEFLEELSEIEFITRDNMLDLNPRLIDEQNRDLAYVLLYDLEEIVNKLHKWQIRIIEKYDNQRSNARNALEHRKK